MIPNKKKLQKKKTISLNVFLKMKYVNDTS